MEKALDVVHQSNPPRHDVTLSYSSRNGSVGLFCRFPSELKTTVLSQLAAAYPDSSITILADDALKPSPHHQTWTTAVRLRRDIYPIRRHSEFTDSNKEALDPVGGPAGCPAVRAKGQRTSVGRVAVCSVSTVSAAERSTDHSTADESILSFAPGLF